MSPGVVIVGTSIGGVRTAQTLRSEGYVGRIVLIGEDPAAPYDKPPLSKQLLAGDWDVNAITLLRPEDAVKARVETRLGAGATALDLAHRRIELDNGEELAFDKLVVATGARPRPVPWKAGSGVYELRTLADAAKVRGALQRPGRVVVIGGGFIGAEVAAAAHKHGRPVTIVDPLTAPAGRVVGDEVGEILAKVHERHGVSTRFGSGVERLDGEEGALTVTLTDGEELPAHAVVVGIGVIPNTDWLESSGLLIDNGLVCDSDCQAVGAHDVFGVGDVARWFHGRHSEAVRVEHWTNAVDQAQCVARNLLLPRDDRRCYRPTEYVWSDQYDWKIQITGRPATCDRHELLGNPSQDPPRFIALYQNADRELGGAVAVNWARASATARRHVDTSTRFAHALDAIAQLKIPV